jgi:hypothetical protein
MKELCHFKFKDKTSLSFETIPVEVKQNYVKNKEFKIKQKSQRKNNPIPIFNFNFKTKYHDCN